MAPAADLHQDLVFRATFNKSLNAEKSSGDPQLYSAPNYQTAEIGRASCRERV